MYYRIGRKNLALTVFVPYDCKNTCRFCASKRSYKEKKSDPGKVAESMKRVLYRTALPIKDVVFTGGEPMEDVNALKNLVKLVPKRMNIYINTTFIRKNMEEFVEMVNTCWAIKGVNISRHEETFERDEYMLDGIAKDEDIQRIKKPVRINCVEKGQNLQKIVERWEGKGVELSIRRDFRKPMTDTELHSPYDHTALALIESGFKFVGKTQCNVCDTTYFIKENGMRVQYHKGLMRTSIEDGFALEINDLIIDQAGDIAYDWEGCDTDRMKNIMRNSEKLYDEWDNHGQYEPGKYEPSTCGGAGC